LIELESNANETVRWIALELLGLRHGTLLLCQEAQSAAQPEGIYSLSQGGNPGRTSSSTWQPVRRSARRQAEWYRYYQLFADVLQARLRLELPTVRVVHERASTWYERHGQQYDAIRHALAASNFERAAGPD
jgi:hypothetical protein